MIRCMLLLICLCILWFENYYIVLRIPLYDFNPALKNWSYVHVLIKIEPPKSLPHQSHCAQWPDLTSRETKVWLSQTPSEILIALSGFYNHTPVVIFRTLKSENLIGHTQNLITWTQEKKHNSVFKRASSPVIVYVGGHSYYVFFLAKLRQPRVLLDIFSWFCNRLLCRICK